MAIQKQEYTRSTTSSTVSGPAPRGRFWEGSTSYVDGNEYAATRWEHTQMDFRRFSLKSAPSSRVRKAGRRRGPAVSLYVPVGNVSHVISASMGITANKRKQSDKLRLSFATASRPVDSVHVLELMAVLDSDIVRMQPPASLPIQILILYC